MRKSYNSLTSKRWHCQGKIKVKPPGLKVIAAPVVGGSAKQIAQLKLFASKVGEGQVHVTLALMRRIVNGYQQALATGILPCERDKSVGRRMPSQAGTRTSNCHWPPGTRG